MSPILIGALIGGGLLILLGIGFISHGLERARLERARLSAELQARLKVCQSVNHQLPGQFMSPELKKLLLSLEAHLLDKLSRLERKEQRTQQQLTAVRQLLAQPDIQVENAPQKIDSAAVAKDTRHLLENLRGLLLQAHSDGLLDKAGLQQWSAQVRQHLITTALEMFRIAAEQGMRENKPRVAKLQYERAIAYLSNLKSPAYAQHIEHYKMLLRKAEEATLRAEQSTAPGASELSAGLQELEQVDEAWKKKAVYDD